MGGSGADGNSGRPPARSRALPVGAARLSRGAARLRRGAARLRRGAARLSRGAVRLRPLTGAAVLSAAAVVVVLLTAVWPADRRSVGDPSVGDVVRVGVRQGDSIPAYLRSNARELAALPGRSPLATVPGGSPLATVPGGSPLATVPPETYALVTLAEYLAPDRLGAVLQGVAVSAVHARHPMPRVQTGLVRIPATRVPADVVIGLRAAALRKEAEAAEYRRLSAALAGRDAGEQSRRQVYDNGAAVAAAEAAAFRRGCACLYAAVVRAPATVLDRLAARPEVRTVDPAPEVRRIDRAVFLPPLPEQTDVVRPPPDDRLNGADSTAPSTRAGR